MTNEEILKLIKTKAYDGDDYLSIKKELGRLELSKEESRLFLMQLDEYIVDYKLAEQARSNALIQMMMGAVFLILGLVMIKTSVTTSKSNLWYGAIIGGAWLCFRSFQKYRSPVEALINKSEETSKRKFDRF